MPNVYYMWYVLDKISETAVEKAPAENFSLSEHPGLR